MKKIALAAFLFLSVCVWAGANPNPAEYTINVHVTSSNVAVNLGYQVLDVVIDGKKYKLGSELRIGHLLALGDYKAKLVENQHQTTYDSVQVYEFLFSDMKTRQYLLVGQSE